MKRALAFLDVYFYLRRHCSWGVRPAIRRAWECSRE